MHFFTPFPMGVSFFKPLHKTYIALYELSIAVQNHHHRVPYQQLICWLQIVFPAP